MTNLEKIKLQLGLIDTGKDTLLGMLLEDALTDIETYTNYNTDNIDDDTLDNVTRKLVVVAYNKLGIEGSNYYAEGSTVYTFDKASALSALNNYRVPILSGIRDSSESV